jgi:predicted dehydrogenase
MHAALPRRSFLKRTALAAGAWSVAPALLRAAEPGRRLNCVQIGCGGRGLGSHIAWLVTQTQDNVVALVDADERQHAKAKRYLERKGRNAAGVKTFTDYRVMFEQIGNSVDAVFIATPNHHHAAAAELAIEQGKAVYCEKPLCHDIAEARKLRALAARSKAAAQMGNQGHCQDGYRSLCECVWAGLVGNITETHSWTDRANGGFGPRPTTEPVPAGLHWDDWIGPAPFRPYHPGLHPHDWHGWYDFGNGSLGNMGCHVLDGVFWALKVEHPSAIEAEQLRGGTDERYPTGGRIRWDVPARGSLPPLKVYWYEGFKEGAKGEPSGQLSTAKGGARNLPPLLLELQQRYPDEEFDTNGTLYVGDKGVLYTGTYGGRMHLLPLEKWQSMKHPPRTLPRPQNVFTDFLEACRAGKKETAASFEYGARLTEFVLLGNLAEHAGVGRKVEWDGPGMRVTNLPELNEWVSRPCRQGWSV